MLSDWNELSDEARKEIDPQYWQKLPDRTEEEKSKSNRLINVYVSMARAIRENLPGVNFRRPPSIQFGAGNYAARQALFAFWKKRGSRWMRNQWNAFPRKVRIAIAGQNRKLLWDIPKGSPGRVTMHRLWPRARPMLDSGCQGRGKCPRAKKFREMLDGGIDNKEVLAWYRRLSTAERESFCRVHVSTPIRPAQVSREANLVKRKGFPTPFTKADRPEPPCYFRIKGERRLLKGIRSKGFALLEFLYSAYVGGREYVAVSEIGREVWGDSRTTWGTIKPHKTEILKALESAHIPFRIGSPAGPRTQKVVSLSFS